MAHDQGDKKTHQAVAGALNVPWFILTTSSSGAMLSNIRPEALKLVMLYAPSTSDKVFSNLAAPPQ